MLLNIACHRKAQVIQGQNILLCLLFLLMDLCLSPKPNIFHLCLGNIYTKIKIPQEFSCFSFCTLKSILKIVFCFCWNTVLCSIPLQDNSLVLHCNLFSSLKTVKSLISISGTKLILWNCFPLLYKNQPLHGSSISPCSSCPITPYTTPVWMALATQALLWLELVPTSWSHLLCSLKNCGKIQEMRVKRKIMKQICGSLTEMLAWLWSDASLKTQV